MIRKFFFLLFTILFTGCSFVSQPAHTPSEEILLKPTAVPPTVPPATPTEIPATVSPEPTTDPNLFRDDFTESLDAQWSWVREDPLNWSLIDTPGSLQINVSRGYVPAHNNSNLLLRPAPGGNFQIQTQIKFRPRDNFQFAGLIIYESDSNFIQAGRAYCSSVGCIGEGLYMDYYKKGVVVKPNFGQIYKGIDPILLRLSRRENIYTFEVSTDGRVWFIIGSHTSDMNPLQIGLVAGQRLKGDHRNVVFDYFEVRSLP
jgi:beta-xylosidase